MTSQDGRKRHLSEEQIQAARQVGTLAYLQTFEPDQLITSYYANGQEMKCKKGEFRTREHDSLVVMGDRFYWWSRRIGGNSALDYLMKVRGCSFYDAVTTLTGEQAPMLASVSQSYAVQPPQQERKEFVLPERAESCSRVMAYLIKTRGIAPEIVKSCVKAGIVFEDAAHHNAAFVGNDENGTPRFCSLRGTGTGSHWRMDQPGSDKHFAFRMGNPEASHVMVFEAPIDAMSMATFLDQQGADWTVIGYVTLSGVSPLALEQYLQTHAEVSKVTLALDGDEAGQNAASSIRQQLAESHPMLEVHIIKPAEGMGKDWNDVILKLRDQKQEQQSAEQKPVQKQEESQPRQRPPNSLSERLADANGQAEERRYRHGRNGRRSYEQRDYCQRR